MKQRPGPRFFPVSAAILLCALTLAGCGSLETFLAGLGGGGSGSSGNSGSAPPRGTGTDRPSAPPQGTGTGTAAPRRAETYRIPASYAAAYAYRTGTAYRNMQNIPGAIDANRAGNPAEYVRQVAAYINESSSNDFERVKRAHDLTALLVRYDAASFWAGRIPDQSYANVLKTRLAVCEGYANLFKKLCDELRIPCEVVPGYGRGVGASPFDNSNPADSNHAWNIVAINGEHYLVDCTWDSGYMEGRTARQAYSTDWLFLKPEHFLHTHFPENPRQQLLANPVGAAAFSALPLLKPQFFDVVESISPVPGNINRADGVCTLEYAVKAGFDVNFVLYDSSGRPLPNNTFAQYESNRYRAYLSFPAAGRYVLQIFWKKTGDQSASGCGEIGFIANSGSPVRYPLQYASFDKNTEIISPAEMPLRRGGRYEFRVRSDKPFVAIIHGRSLVQLARGPDGIFQAAFEIPAVGELSIGVASSARGPYSSIVQYQVN